MKAKRVLDGLVDPYVVLGMTCIVPLLECINALIKFAQQRDVYICDFIGALVACQVWTLFSEISELVYMLTYLAAIWYIFKYVKQ
jgi:hypothetical protein